MMKYEQAYKDWDYLFNGIAPAADMTGGYVDQDDLARLLKSPTKSTATKCLCEQIEYWFMKGLDRDMRTFPYGMTYGEIAEMYPKVREIADRHGIAEPSDDDEFVIRC